MPCCLCSNPEAPHTEQRRSGREGELKVWHFCRECWSELQRQRADTDSEVCVRYKVFLQFLSGHYRMQRAFMGRQAAKIMSGQNNLDSASRNHVVSTHGKTKTHLECGRCLDGANENPRSSLETESERHNGGMLPGVSETFETEEINRLEADPPGGWTPDGP